MEFKYDAVKKTNETDILFARVMYRKNNWQSDERRFTKTKWQWVRVNNLWAGFGVWGVDDAGKWWCQRDKYKYIE